MDHSFVIYRSSAGSGKTYTLVKEYLLLALKNPQFNYRHILAITFTNKAMQEMKNRIISSLADFRDGKQHPMKDELIAGLNISEEDFNHRCKILLEKILHEYSYFSISTIDAFFQRIIRSFTKELGLYGQYQLEMDQDLVKIQAIDNLLADLKEDEDLTHWVVKFAEEQLEEGKNWDIRRSLSNFAREIFKEHFSELEGDLPSASEIKEFQKILYKEIKGFEGHLHSLGTKGLQILEKKDIDVGELKSKKSGPISFLYKIEKNNFDPPGKNPLKGIESVEAWVSKKADRYDYLVNVVEQELMPLLNDAIEYYNKNHPRYCTAVAALKFIYGFGLLAELNRKVQQYKHERDLLFIQDATKLIKALMKDNDTPFIFEKVGVFIHHYLIDEFQDTSALQWLCLQPLVFDTISQGNMSMVVGDSKQSIYRWRGGDWSLLQHQVVKDITPHPHKLELLKSNYRSAGEIINFNNVIFEYLPKKMLNYEAADLENLQPDTKVLAEQIIDVYHEAHQLIPDGKEGNGYININFINDEDHEDDWTERVLALLPDQIDDILSRGYSLTDIALLVRKKGEAAQLAQHLLSFSTDNGDPKYPVLTNEALLLKNSRAVMVIINALRYMQSQADEIALNELIYHYHKINQPDQDLYFHDLLDKYRRVKKEVLPFDMAKEKFYLMHLPIEEAVEHLIRLFSLPGNSGEAAYLQTFQDKVLEFGRSEGNDIASFLLWWNEKGESESINVPSGLNAISIMTIHKAKGLQFPVVMVPFTSWAIESNHDTILWASSTESPYNNKNIPLKYTSALKQSLFKDAYAHEQLQSALDNLNLLYVAFTRAEQELYSYAPDKPSKKNISTYLKECLSDEDFILNESWVPQHSTFERGKKQKVKVKEDKNVADQVMIRNYRSYDWRDRLVVKKVSSGRTDKMEEALRGTEMHHLLSKINYKDDLDEKSFFKGMDDEPLKQLREIISHPEIAGFFDKPYKVLNEKSILAGKDVFRPDRVVIEGSKAVIIDYKWGHKQDHYKNQIRTYLQLLQSLGYKETAGYLYYVDQKSVEKIL